MTDAYWCILPAAGIGSRMQTDRPKQYLSLNQRYLIDHTLDCILSYSKFAGVVLALAADDEYWQHSEYATHNQVQRANGGSERCYSVLNALRHLEHQAQPQDWVLVHDVARPCLQHSDLDKLLNNTNADGAILATPVRDTMKRGNAKQQIDHTVERQQLWHALTPQKFRYAALLTALEHCLASNIEVTDEASALEMVGQQPALVEGRADNIKVTRPEDLALAQFFLTQK